MKAKQFIWEFGRIIISLCISSVPESWCWYVTDSDGWQNQYWVGFRKSIRANDPRVLYGLHLGPILLMFGLKPNKDNIK